MFSMQFIFQSPCNATDQSNFAPKYDLTTVTSSSITSTLLAVRVGAQRQCKTCMYFVINIFKVFSSIFLNEISLTQGEFLLFVQKCLFEQSTACLWQVCMKNCIFRLAQWHHSMSNGKEHNHWNQKNCCAVQQSVNDRNPLKIQLLTYI